MESRGGVIRDAANAVTRVVVVSNDITNRRAAEEQIHRLAYFDPLTMLPNRRLLIDRLRLIMATTRRNSRFGALLFLDLDNFKPVNDAHGHGVGDLLLVEAAGRLTKCVREVDTVARFGGDEFVVLLGDLDATKAESESAAFLVAEKIRNRMSEPFVLPVHHQGEEDHFIKHQCTSSIGVVLFLDGEYCEEDILRWADIAMYQAKENGRNQVCLIDPHSGNTISAPQ
jgi:diguanylate cyclase (GGDEF)-like protein